VALKTQTYKLFRPFQLLLFFRLCERSLWWPLEHCDWWPIPLRGYRGLCLQRQWRLEFSPIIKILHHGTVHKLSIKDKNEIDASFIF